MSEQLSQRTKAELEANRSNRPIRAPNRSRHARDGIGRRSRPDARNSVVLPWVDMVHDTNLIRLGYADKLPDDRYRINGRTCFVEGTEHGTLVPGSGEGIVSLTRQEFRALVTIAQYGGYEGKAEQELGRDPHIPARAIERASALYQLRSKKP